MEKDKMLYPDPEKIEPLLLKLDYWPPLTQTELCPAIRIQVRQCRICKIYYIEYFALQSTDIDSYDDIGYHCFESHTCPDCQSK